HDALAKGARSATDIGEFAPTSALRDSMFTLARSYAERAVQADTSDAEGYFQLSRALGRIALAASPTGRVPLARLVQESALHALALNPHHAGALDVLGMWNAQILRAGGFERMIAKTFLGADFMKQASWDVAVKDLEAAVADEPDRIVHHLDLA